MLTEEIKQEKAEKIRQLFPKLTYLKEVEGVKNEKLLPWSYNTYFHFHRPGHVEKTTSYNKKFFVRPLDKAILCAEIQPVFSEIESYDKFSNKIEVFLYTKFHLNFSLWEKTSDEFKIDEFKILESTKLPIRIEPIEIYKSYDLEEGIKRCKGNYYDLFYSTKLQDILRVVKKMEGKEIIF